MQKLNLYHTASRKQEPFPAEEKKSIKVYACGPTVYNYAHIGNLRTYIFEDLLLKTLRFLGYQVHHVMNLTDVEDKTIRSANAEGIALAEYTKRYINAFFEDLEALHIQRADETPRATDYIPSMIRMIETLIAKGHAYKDAKGNVYFKIASFKRYGALSNLNLDELKVGASNRLDDEYDKESLSDFVLWKAYDEQRDGPVHWESPFGRGRPGWHIECSTMAVDTLGETLDLHVGGEDNIFPHHENEIAQSECCTEKPFARHWTHASHLIVDGKKMSKSLGNFYTLRDLLDKGYSGRAVRFALISTHYRSQLNFTFEGLDAAKNALCRMDDFVDRMRSTTRESSKKSVAVHTTLEKSLQAFTSALTDDLNISSALAVLFELIREGNRLADEQALSKSDCEQVLSLLQSMDQVLGLIFTRPEEEIPADISEALEKRTNAREKRDFATSDAMRDYIHDKGYTIEDTPKGPRLKKR